MKTEKVFKRKKELIKRDPAYHELEKLFNKIKGNLVSSKPFFSEPKFSNLLLHYADPVLIEMQHFNPSFFWYHNLDEYKHNPGSYPEIYKFLKSVNWNPRSMEESDFTKEYDNFIEMHKTKYPDHWELERLIGDIRCKWHVDLVLTCSSKISITPLNANDEAIWVGSSPVILGADNTIISDFNKYPQLNWLPYPNPFNKKPVLADINEFITPGYNKTSDTYIPIVINLSRLNNNDAKQVKKTIWEIIKSNLPKKIRRPYHELQYELNPEFAFLYGIRREDTFHKYLWWYDIRTKEKLSFRLIALIDNENNPQRALNLLKEFSRKKVKWEIHVKGEDKIEKGVKLIYKAIHRIDYSTKEQEAEFTEYSCPTHKDNNCRHSCKYRKEWLDRFNRLMPEIKL